MIGRRLAGSLVDSLVKAVAAQLASMHPEATHFVVRPDGTYRAVISHKATTPNRRNP